MIAALFYLQYHTARNRLVTRFKRLKQPKYLVGAIAGGLYFYLYFFRYLFRSYGGGPAGSFGAAADNRLLYESLAALVLFVMAVLAWLVPGERAALTFSEAEVAFLFPAPVTRRTLIHFKLMRSQWRTLLSALFLSLISRRWGGDFWIHAIGWWLILSTLNLHLIGASFTRTLLLDHGVSNRLRRGIISLLVAGLAGGVWYWAKRTLPSPDTGDTENFQAILNYAREVLDSGPALYLLYPFKLVVQPFFAPDAAAFFAALVPVALILALHYLWVMGADVAFEEASLTASQKLAARTAAVRAGNWQAARKAPKARRAWFQLAPTGPAVTALVWKNLIGVGQVFSARLVIILVVVLAIFISAFGSAGHEQNYSIIAEIAIAAILGYSTLLGPQFLRLDFRRNLPQADVLKSFPLPGWQIALGEILAPVVVLAGFQWVLLLPGLGLVFFLPAQFKSLALVIGLGAALVLPVLDFLLLLIPNAAVLLFPSWFQTGKDSPRGIEATGQRLVMAVGQLLVLVVSLVPAALAFAAVYFPLKWGLGPLAPVPFAALAAALILAVEAALGVKLLGFLFERFDVTEEPAG